MADWKFPEAFLAEVRSRAKVSDLVGASVALKKSGKSLKGLCPFHSEKTPSFHVDDARGLFHCFGCGVGGDVFKFLMLHERLSFPEAVKTVASSVGVPLPESWRPAGDDRRSRLLEVTELAHVFYREQLASPEGRPAREYLDRRGVEAATREAFELGLAPDAWDGLSRALGRKGVKQDELVSCGLCIRRPRSPGVYDRFRGRVLFPIRTAGGALVGFGGRALGDAEPKYLNSPETELYAKGDILYGLNLARHAVRKLDRCVLVEGYMDLIMLHQAGIEETVATLGTALTTSHARLLGRYTQRLYLCYDGDRAGRQAAGRALEGLVPAGFDVRVVRLGEEQDPDDFVRAHGADRLARELDCAVGFVDYLVGDSLPEETEGRVRLAARVAEMVARLPDAVSRRLHAARLAERLGVEDRVVLAQLRAARGGGGGEAETSTARPAFKPDEKRLLKALFSDRPWSRELAEQLPREALEGRAAGRALGWARRRRLDRLPLEAADPELEETLGSSEAAAVREVLLDDQGTPTPTRQEAREALKSLRLSHLEWCLQDLQSRLRSAPDNQLELLQRKQELVRELHRLRQAENLTED